MDKKHKDILHPLYAQGYDSTSHLSHALYVQIESHQPNLSCPLYEIVDLLDCFLHWLIFFIDTVCGFGVGEMSVELMTC